MKYISWWGFCTMTKISGANGTMNTFQIASIPILLIFWHPMERRDIPIAMLRSLEGTEYVWVRHSQKMWPKKWFQWFSNSTPWNMLIQKWRLRQSMLISTCRSCPSFVSSIKRGLQISPEESQHRVIIYLNFSLLLKTTFHCKKKWQHQIYL